MGGSNHSLKGVCPKTSTKLTFDNPIINASLKDTYSENFINIQPQIAELGTIWWPKPEVN